MPFTFETDLFIDPNTEIPTPWYKIKLHGYLIGEICPETYIARIIAYLPSPNVEPYYSGNPWRYKLLDFKTRSIRETQAMLMTHAYALVHKYKLHALTLRRTRPKLSKLLSEK